MNCVGVTGFFAAGKTTAAKIFSKELGARVFSLADEVRLEAGKRGLEPTVGNLSRLANEFRKRRGAGFWAKRVLEKMKRPGSEWVVAESIRSPAEARIFRNFFGKRFFFVCVSAPEETRFKRFRRTPRGREFRSFKEFKSAEGKQLRGGRRSQGLEKVVEGAAFVLENSGSLRDLEKGVKALALELRRAAGSAGERS